MRLPLIPSVLVAALVSGCMPFPHHEPYSPRVSGIVTREGYPIAGAQIRVSSRQTKAAHVGISDSTGRFEIAPLREFSWLIFIGDRGTDYTLEITADDKAYKGYWGRGLGLPPKRLYIACELSHLNETTNSTTYCLDQPQK
jgi:hypothetical protein